MQPCDLLFVHRDAEKQGADARYEEIATAVTASSLIGVTPHIPVVPVRMSEAWLLIEEAAIRRAAGNPRGRIELAVPSLGQIESMPEPKAHLCTLLTEACELTGRRLKSFRPIDRIPLVASYIQDYSPLRKLSAFQRLETFVQQFATAYLNANSE